MDAIYVRQSVDKKDSISIESQIDFCKKELCASEYKIYSDKGYSGSNTKRPSFEEMMNDIKLLKIQKVIVYKLDRISRSLLDFAHIIDQFNKYGVEFLSCTEKFDTASPMGRAMLSIIMVFAQLERETIQKRITDNYYTRGRKGFYLGGGAPFGYTKIETSLDSKKTYTFEQNPKQAEIVKHIFDLYANCDQSLGDVANYLNSNGYITNKKNLWSSVSIGRLIRNPVYVMADVGVYLYLKSKGAVMNNDISNYLGKNACFVYGERKKNSKSKFTDLNNQFVTLALHKGIIPSDIWLMCQSKLDQNKQMKNSGKGTHTWLSGLLKCGYCGYAINAVNGYKDTLYINCGGRKLKTCFDRKRVIYLQDIENIVKSKLLNKLKTLTYYEPVSSNDDFAKINELKAEIIKTDQKIEKLLHSYLDEDDVSAQYLKGKLLELDSKKNVLLSKIDQITTSEVNHQTDRKLLPDYSVSWDLYSFEQKKEVAKTLIDRVTVLDDEMEIIFRI